MDLVEYVGVKQRRAQRVAAGAPLGAAFVGARVLRPQQLELRREGEVALVDLLRVDEAEAPAGAGERGPLLAQRLAQPELPRVLLLRFPHRRRGGAGGEGA